MWAKEAGLLSATHHDHLAAHCNRNPREAEAALAKGTAIRDLLLAIFAGIANRRPLSSQRLSQLNSALAQAPGLLHVHKNSNRIEMEWTSAADGVEQVLFAVLSSAAELSPAIACGEFVSAPHLIAPGCLWTRAVTTAGAGAR